jgi:hypothetical protein
MADDPADAKTLTIFFAILSVNADEAVKYLQAMIDTKSDRIEEYVAGLRNMPKKQREKLLKAHGMTETEATKLVRDAIDAEQPGTIRGVFRNIATTYYAPPGNRKR